jgi:hypothetical protein
MGDVIVNGSFEEGFDQHGIALGWTPFSNDRALYEWAGEPDAAYVSHGAHAQLMRISEVETDDRYIGIYQTVDVIPGETYTLALHGIMRTSTAERSWIPYGHRVQWAIDYEGKGDWAALLDKWEAWTDTGWNDVRLEARDPTMNFYVLPITAQTEKLSLYIRGWTKWPIMNSEARYYIDGVFLHGPVPGEGSMPTTGGKRIWIPIVGAIFVLGFALWEIRRLWASR